MELHYPVILDGATGTELQKRGFKGDMAAEQWVLEHPDAMIGIQQAYVAAGSNIVYAPTFSANRIKLEENGLGDRVEAMNVGLVSVSRSAVDGRAWVAGDLSPTGKFPVPVGDVTFEQLVEIYREQARALEQAGVDLYVVETMMTVSDARAAVLAIREISTKPIFVTFTCDAVGRTIFGSDITAVLQIMQGMEINAFGMNCSVGPEDMLKQLKRLQKYAELPLIAKPNAGLPETVDGKTVYNCPADEFASIIPDFAEAGVCIFGGCCGTDQSHIAAIADALRMVTVKAPRPAVTGLLAAPTEKELFMLPANIRCDCVLACDAKLGEALEELEGKGVSLIGIRLNNDTDIENFTEAQYAISAPICFHCEDVELLEKALRIYQGRALYEGSIPEEKLQALHRRYGLNY